jgi:hypothetical protein
VVRWAAAPLLLAGAFLVAGSMAGVIGGGVRSLRGALISGTFAATGIATVVVALGMRRLKSWARWPAVLISAAGIVGVMALQLERGLARIDPWAPVLLALSAMPLTVLLSRRTGRLFTPEYARLIAATPELRYSPSPRVIALLLLSAAAAGLAVLIGLGR